MLVKASYIISRLKASHIFKINLIFFYYNNTKITMTVTVTMTRKMKMTMKNKMTTTATIRMTIM